MRAEPPELPRKMVWAWERDEDLRWLPKDYGIARVEYAIKLVGERVTIRRNLNRFSHQAETVVLPIVHVDSSFVTPPALNRQQLVAIVRSLLITAHQSRSHWVQLDFEVVESQKPFLAEVIHTKLRQLNYEKDRAANGWKHLEFKKKLLEQTQ
ncbi:MAG: hypothetical protein ORO03_06670 [Alphaproteobacteria bacterium]|nr:hypothetical protein [Alphaproteobacteria bacterium]